MSFTVSREVNQIKKKEPNQIKATESYTEVNETSETVEEVKESTETIAEEAVELLPDEVIPGLSIQSIIPDDFNEETDDDVVGIEGKYKTKNIGKGLGLNGTTKINLVRSQLKKCKTEKEVEALANIIKATTVDFQNCITDLQNAIKRVQKADVDLSTIIKNTTNSVDAVAKKKIKEMKDREKIAKDEIKKISAKIKIMTTIPGFHGSKVDIKKVLFTPENLNEIVTTDANGIPKIDDGAMRDLANFLKEALQCCEERKKELASTISSETVVTESYIDPNNEKGETIPDEEDDESSEVEVDDMNIDNNKDEVLDKNEEARISALESFIQMCDAFTSMLTEAEEGCTSKASEGCSKKNEKDSKCKGKECDDDDDEDDDDEDEDDEEDDIDEDEMESFNDAINDPDTGDAYGNYIISVLKAEGAEDAAEALEKAKSEKKPLTKKLYAKVMNYLNSRKKKTNSSAKKREITKIQNDVKNGQMTPEELETTGVVDPGATEGCKKKSSCKAEEGCGSKATEGCKKKNSCKAEEGCGGSKASEGCCKKKDSVKAEEGCGSKATEGCKKKAKTSMESFTEMCDLLSNLIDAENPIENDDTAVDDTIAEEGVVKKGILTWKVKHGQLRQEAAMMKKTAAKWIREKNFSEARRCIEMARERFTKIGELIDGLTIDQYRTQVSRKANENGFEKYKESIKSWIKTEEGKLNDMEAKLAVSQQKDAVRAMKNAETRQKNLDKSAKESYATEENEDEDSFIDEEEAEFAMEAALQDLEDALADAELEEAFASIDDEEEN